MDCASFTDVREVGADDGVDDAPDVVGVFALEGGADAALADEGVRAVAADEVFCPHCEFPPGGLFPEFHFHWECWIGRGGGEGGIKEFDAPVNTPSILFHLFLHNPYNSSRREKDFMRIPTRNGDIICDRCSLYPAIRRGVPKRDSPVLVPLLEDVGCETEGLEHFEGTWLEAVGVAGDYGGRLEIEGERGEAVAREEEGECHSCWASLGRVSEVRCMR